MSITAMKPHRVPFFVPMFNPFVRVLVRLGIRLGPQRAPMVLLTIRGRKTGASYTNPVNMFRVNGRRYVFATFGETSWVKNLRAAGRAELTEGRRRLVVDALVLRPEAAAPIMREALMPFLRSPATAIALKRFYTVVHHDATLEDFVTEAGRHPAFELRELSRPSSRIASAVPRGNGSRT